MRRPPANKSPMELAGESPDGHIQFWRTPAVRHVRHMLTLRRSAKPSLPPRISELAEICGDPDIIEQLVTDGYRQLKHGGDRPDLRAAVEYFDHHWPSFGMISQTQIISASTTMLLRVARGDGRVAKEMAALCADLQ